MQDPGPPGDFEWSGFNWVCRDGGRGAPGRGGWSRNNVVGPDPEGQVRLRVTNPTGRQPIGAEIRTTRRGFGYGTYTTTVAKVGPTLPAMHKCLVFGGLFTYDYDSPPGHHEIDVCEASAWGGGPRQDWDVHTNHSVWFDATKPPGSGNLAQTFLASSEPVQTHRMVWQPGSVACESFAGGTVAGKLLKRTTFVDARVPSRGREALFFNFWIFGSDEDPWASVGEDEVILRSVSFEPLVPLVMDVKQGDDPAALRDAAPAPLPKRKLRRGRR